ncbi:MAG: GNAT superfamily N-acetyltransferase [Bacteroidia bacterium]|jgi:GNAT superfamily N-acetyltransferase
MEVKPNIQLKRLDDSRLRDVQFLYETVFKNSISLDVLTKKYDTSYLGVKHLTYLAYDGDKPVAFYGALPQKMNYRGESILAVHTCDSLTLPAYQRKGIHKMLALKAYDLMKQEGIRFVYAYHSENTLHSCKKLDWELAFTMKGFMIKTNRIPIAKAVTKIQLLKAQYNAYALRVLKPFQISDDDFKNSNSNSGLFQDYNKSFFDYKCFTNNLIIELDNVKFWVKVSNRVSVGDVNFQSESDLLNGIESLKKLTDKLGLNEILFQTSPGTKLEHALSTHFKAFDSWKVGYYLFNKDININEFRGNFSDFDTF